MVSHCPSRALSTGDRLKGANGRFSFLPSSSMTSSSVFQQPVDMCHSFTSPQGGGREPLPAPYQHQLSEPCPPYPQQNFKQEYHDPLYEQAGQPASSQGGVSGHRYPGAGVVIKQERTDFAYDSGKRLLGWAGGVGLGRVFLGLPGGVASTPVSREVKQRFLEGLCLSMVHTFFFFNYSKE